MNAPTPNKIQVSYGRDMHPGEHLVQGSVTVNGKPVTEMSNCVVDYELGLLTLGTWEDALRFRAEYQAWERGAL